VSPIAFSLILSVGVVAAAPLVYCLVFIVIEATIFGSDTEALLASTCLCGPLYVVAWVLVWRRHVLWSAHRTIATVLAVIGSVLFGGLILLGLYVFLSALRRHVDSALIVVVGSSCFALAWIVLAARAGMETDDERHNRLSRGSRGNLPCPKCGYNLTGLREATCPECGTKYTLDELVSAVADRRSDLSSRESSS